MAGFLDARHKAIEMLKKGITVSKMTRNGNVKKPYKRVVFLSPSLDRVLWGESREDIRGYIMCCDVKNVLPNPGPAPAPLPLPFGISLVCVLTSCI
jgi:hypothetical protein